MIEETVLIYLEANNQYLMMFRNKRENDYNKGKFIGIGGHIESGETPEEALVREVKEETNLDLINFTKRGEIRFLFDDYIEIMHVYHSIYFIGLLKPSSDEGEIMWIDKTAVFNLNIFESDKIFLKDLMENNDYFKYEFNYKGGNFIGYKKY